jgi:ring-1,2-phenylacetyl-CoA epoxidase subunit PaaC
MSGETMSDLNHDAPSSTLPIEIRDTLLAFADDEFIIGHRHSQWLGLSPFLEEDLTMASIAQDELAHARVLYQVMWPNWKNRDEGVVRRPAAQWRSSEFVEQRIPSWEGSLIRHFLYDVAETHRWRFIIKEIGDQVEGLPAVSESALAEESFHRRHAIDLVTRLGTANPESNAKLQGSLDEIWPTFDSLARCAPIRATLNTSRPEWFNDATAEISRLLNNARLSLPSAPFVELSGGDRTTRHADFNEVQESVLAVFAFDPDATW